MANGKGRDKSFKIHVEKFTAVVYWEWQHWK